MKCSVWIGGNYAKNGSWQNKNGRFETTGQGRPEIHKFADALYELGVKV